MRLKIGIPKRGLQESTINLFQKAGYRLALHSRSYYPFIYGPGLAGMLIRLIQDKKPSCHFSDTMNHENRLEVLGSIL